MSEELDLDFRLPMEDELDVERIRVSPSKIRCFMEDQAQYYFRYVERRKSPVTTALFEGTTYHRAAEYSLQRKKEEGKLPPLQETLIFLRKYWNTYHPKAVDGSAPDQDEFIQIAQVVEALYPTLETITPKLLESYVLTPETEHGYDVQGYIDCIHTDAPGGETFNPDHDTVIDFKSKGQAPGVVLGSPTMGNFDELQLTMYGWALTKGEAPVKSEIIYLVKTRVPKIVRVPKLITPEQMKVAMKTVTRIVEAIEEGRYTPNYGHWLCRSDKCEFWKDCHERF